MFFNGKWKKLALLQSAIQRWNKTSKGRIVLNVTKRCFYKGNYKNIIGKNIKAEYPKFSHITIKNNFNKSVNVLAKELIIKINKIIKLWNPWTNVWGHIVYKKNCYKYNYNNCWNFWIFKHSKRRLKFISNSTSANNA